MRIAYVPHARAGGRLKALCDRIKGPDDNVSNIMQVHSLRPHTLEGRVEQSVLLRHAGALTRAPQAVDALRTHADAMCAVDPEDGCIFEVNQVVAHLNYADCTLLCLGVAADGDVGGLSPGNSDNFDDWTHR